MKAGLQFHATPAELVGLADGWARDYELHAALTHFFEPVQVTLVTAGNLLAAVEESVVTNEIVLSRRPLCYHSHRWTFLGQNDSLIVSIGDLRPEGLRESALGLVSDDPDMIRMGRRIIRRLRDSMPRGAWVVNPMSGARGLIKSHRYTEGARALALTGVPMLAVGGCNVYEFIDGTDGQQRRPPGEVVDNVARADDGVDARLCDPR